jgi:hypothetical protein
MAPFRTISWLAGMFLVFCIITPLIWLLDRSPDEDKIDEDMF